MPIAVVDGMNLAFAERADGKPRIANIPLVREALEERGYEVIVIVDASLKHHCDDPKRLEWMIEKGTVKQVPAGTDADFFVLKTAEETGGIIVSNDKYRDWKRKKEFKWVDERRVPAMIVDGIVELYEPKLEETA